MKDQALFSLEDKSKKLKCHLVQFLFCALRFKPCCTKVLVELLQSLWCQQCLYNIQKNSYRISSIIRRSFFLPKQSQRSRSVLYDGSRSLGLFRKGKNWYHSKIS